MPQYTVNYPDILFIFNKLYTSLKNLRESILPGVHAAYLFLQALFPRFK